MENLSKNGIARLLTRPLQFAVKSSGQKLRRRRNIKLWKNWNNWSRNLCIQFLYKPFSDLKSWSHWSHLKTLLFLSSASFSGAVSFSEDFLSVEGTGFFCRNSALLLAFLLKADGLFLFFDLVDEPSPLVSKENEKEPTLRAKLKVCT